MDLQQTFLTMDWSEVLSYLLNAAGLILGSMVTFHVIPWLEQKTKNTWVEQAVRAAEQIFSATGSGAQKKAYVTSYLVENGILRIGKGGQIPDDINAAIESVVQQLNEAKQGWDEADYRGTSI